MICFDAVLIKRIFLIYHYHHHHQCHHNYHQHHHHELINSYSLCTKHPHWLFIEMDANLPVTQFKSSLWLHIEKKRSIILSSILNKKTFDKIDFLNIVYEKQSYLSRLTFNILLIDPWIYNSTSLHCNCFDIHSDTAMTWSQWRAISWY